MLACNVHENALRMTQIIARNTGIRTYPVDLFEQRKYAVGVGASASLSETRGKRYFNGLLWV